MIPKSVDFYENLVNLNPNFYSKTEVVDDIPFKIFNYRIGKYKDFKDYNAFECRGIAFNMLNGEPIWGIHKFFNVDEVEDTSWENIKNKKFDIYEKVDGSLIATYIFQGKIYVKTNGSFYSDQAIEAGNIIKNNQIIENAIRLLEANSIQAIFEYVAPENQIVLYYEEPDLVLIQGRNKVTGGYIPLDFLKQFLEQYGLYISCAKKTYIDDLQSVYNMEGIEGFVIENQYNKREKYKIKTKWYLDRHRVLGDNELKWKEIVPLILNNKIDDVLSFLTPKSYKYHQLIEMQATISELLAGTIKAITDIIAEMRTNNMSRKEIVIKYKDCFYFHALMMSINKPDDIENNVKEWIKKNTVKKRKADDFMEHLPKKGDSNEIR